MYPSEIVKQWFRQFIVDGKINFSLICKYEGIALIRELEVIILFLIIPLDLLTFRLYGKVGTKIIYF